jgi:hypothetical protein
MAAGMIRGSEGLNFFPRDRCLVAAMAATNHPYAPAATCLGAEVVVATTVGVIRGFGSGMRQLLPQFTFAPP